MVSYHHLYHCFPVDKYDTLEYSWVKATSVSMCLQIYLYALINTNKLSGTVAGETVVELTTNLA